MEVFLIGKGWEDQKWVEPLRLKQEGSQPSFRFLPSLESLPSSLPNPAVAVIECSSFQEKPGRGGVRRLAKKARQGAVRTAILNYDLERPGELEDLLPEAEIITASSRSSA